MLWECDNCGKVVESDPLAHDDWTGEEVAIGPDCEECGEPMELVKDQLLKDMEEMEKLLGNVPVLFGLKAQGHLPTVERMVNEGRTWEEIGKEIGWEPNTAKRHWEMHLSRKE